MKFSKIFSLAALSLASFLVISSCNRKEDTIAKVFVYDESNNPISGAQVILRPEPSENSVGKTLIEPDTTITNSTGEAIFNFNDLYQLGQAGVVVLNVYASKDGMTGEGVIQVIEEETSEVDVRIK